MNKRKGRYTRSEHNSRKGPYFILYIFTNAAFIVKVHPTSKGLISLTYNHFESQYMDAHVFNAQNWQQNSKITFKVSP